jgi:hypothetical protein
MYCVNTECGDDRFEAYAASQKPLAPLEISDM